MEINNYAQIAPTGAPSIYFVVNVVAWDGESTYKIPSGMKLVRSDVAGIGYLYNEDTGTFTNPFKDAELVEVTEEMVI